MAMARRETSDNFILRFIRETRSELNRVIWPSRQDALRLTGIVIGVTLGMAAGLTIIDFVFARLIGLVLR